MPNYAVRITHPYFVAQRIVAVWATKCVKMAVFSHIGEKTEKPHIHLALEGTSVDKKQLRNLASATGISVKGNEYMSFKDLDAEGGQTYYVYMTKGVHSADYLLGWSVDDVEAWKKLWVPPAEHKKRNPWVELGEKFLAEMPPDLLKHNVAEWLSSADAVPKDNRYNILKDYVHRWNYKRYDGWVTPAGRRESQFLIYNVAMKYGIPVPEAIKY